MNTVVILSGGTGTRMGENTPKQYIVVGGKPIFTYCLETFEKNALVDEIVIVAAEEWQEFILQHIQSISKFKCFAPAGSSRLHSIVLGVQAADPATKCIVVHDAVRPNVTDDLITRCILGVKEHEFVLPSLPMKDTIIYSENGSQITGWLKRASLFAGQTPEGFRYDKYLHVHDGMTEEEMSTITGSGEIAYRSGFTTKLIEGDEHNYKITTPEDLEKFKIEKSGK